MITAEKIGLLPGFGWLADLTFAGVNGLGVFTGTLIVCWAISPGVMFLLGWVFEGRTLPWRPSEQYLSFIPGDLFLGIMAAGLLTAARSLPDASRWFNSPVWHLLVLAVTVLVAFILTYGEWKSGAYPTRAILSPTKPYHNGVLCALYGYVIVTTLVALAASHSDRVFLLALVPGVIWVSLVAIDNRSPETMAHKAALAHVADWRPSWSR